MCVQGTGCGTTTGTTSSYRRLTGSRRRVSAWRFALMRRSPSRRSTTRSSSATWTMPSACRRTRAWSWKSKTSSFVRRDGRAARPLVRLQEFSLPGEELDHAQTDCRQGGAPPGRAVPSRRLHRDQHGPWPSRSVVRFYNKRGTAEQWIKDGKQATHWTRLSCHRFRANEVRLQLSVLAYNLGNLWRRLVLPPRIKRWSLTSPQQRLVKTGGRLVKHARYYWLLLAEGHLTRRLFGDMLRRISALPVPERIAGHLPPKGMFVREQSPRGEGSGPWPRNKELRPVPRRRGLS